MEGEGQLREQAKKQWEKIDAEGHKIINNLLVADTERTRWPENTEPKFTRKKGAKLIKVAFDTKIKKYMLAHKRKEEVPVEEPIRLDIPDSYIYFSFHPTLICNQNHTHSQNQHTKSHQGCTFGRSTTEENCRARMLHRAGRNHTQHDYRLIRHM